MIFLAAVVSLGCLLLSPVTNAETAECPRPPLTGSLDIKSVNVKDVYYAGDQIGFECKDPNHLIDGEIESECLPNGEWSSVPVCNPKPRCQLPETPKHATLISEMSGNIIRYECDDGYIIVFDDAMADGYDNDTDSTHTRRCLDNGKWDGEQPICTRYTCNKSKTSIEDGRVYYTGKGLKANPGDSVIYRCNQGYRLVGDYIQTCKFNYGWMGTKPFCAKIYCIAPQVANGYLEPNENVFYPGESVEIHCYDHHIAKGPSKLTCNENFEYNTDAIPICVPQDSTRRSNCSDQGIPHAGWADVTVRQHKVSVRYRCEPNFKLDGKKNLRCFKKEGTWNGVPPRCKSIHTFHDPGKEASQLLSRISTLSYSEDEIPQQTVIYLLIDMSGSTENSTLSSAVNFLAPIVEEIQHHAPQKRIGVIAFSNEAKFILEPTLENQVNVTQHLRKLHSEEAGTNIKAALELALQADEADDVKKIAVLVSDGVYNDGGNPASLADELIKADLSVLLLMVYANTANEFISSLTTNPSEDIFYLSENAYIDENFRLSVEDYSKCGSLSSSPDASSVRIRWGANEKMGFLFDKRWVVARLDTPLNDNDVISVHYGSGLQKTIGIEKKEEMRARKDKELMDTGVWIFFLQEAVEFDIDVRSICLPIPVLGKEKDFMPNDLPNNLRVDKTGNVVHSGNRNESITSASIIECGKRDYTHFCTEGNPEFRDGDAFISELFNQNDLREKRYVLTGLYSEDIKAFISVDWLSSSLFKHFLQYRGTELSK